MFTHRQVTSSDIIIGAADFENNGLDATGSLNTDEYFSILLYPFYPNQSDAKFMMNFSIALSIVKTCSATTFKLFLRLRVCR
jgi:hypothetical protein